MMMLIGELSCRPFLNKVVSPSQSVQTECREGQQVGHDDGGLLRSCFGDGIVNSKMVGLRLEMPMLVVEE